MSGTREWMIDTNRIFLILLDMKMEFWGRKVDTQIFRGEKCHRFALKYHNRKGIDIVGVSKL